MSIDSDGMSLPNQSEKKMDHIFFKIFVSDPEDEEDSIFMSALNDTLLMCRADTINLLPCEDLRNTGLNLPIHLSGELKSIEFCLKYLQEKRVVLNR